MIEAITGGEQAGGVARQSGRVAGDIDEARRPLGKEAGQGLAAEAGAGRVHQNQVGVEVQAAEDDLGLGLVEFDMVELVEVVGKIFAGGGGGFDGDDAADLRGKEGAEEADAGVDFEQGAAGGEIKVLEKVLDHGRRHEGVDLEERSSRDAERPPQDFHYQGLTAGEDERPGRAEMDGGEGQLFDGKGRRLREAAFEDEQGLAVSAQAQAEPLQAGDGFEFKLRPKAVEGFFGQVTFADGDNVVGTRRLETEAAIWGEVELDMVAVIPGTGGGDDGANGGVGQAAQAGKLLGQDGGFDFELEGIGEVLVVATAAVGEMGAARGNALGGGLEHFEQFGPGVAAALFGQPQAQALAGEGKGDEDGLPIGEAPQAIAAIDE